MYYQFNLSGTFSETGAQSGGLVSQINSSPRFRFDHFYNRVEQILSKPKIKTVFINLETDFNPGFMAGVLAIRDQLAKLRDAGLELVFYARSYGLNEMLLASVCQRKVMHPLGSLAHLGLSRSSRFFKNLMDKHDIRAEVIRIGRYKSAGDSFRVSSIDEFAAEQYQAILESIMSEGEKLVAADYGKDVGEVQALRSGTILNSRQAVESGWVSELASLDDIVAGFTESKEKQAQFKKPAMKSGKGSKIAVLVFEGGIKDGKNANSQLMGQLIGSSDYVPVIRKLTRDKSVKGVIFRVNSGGGSAIASEDIAREIARLREKKPVVVSMGQVAGSGGYWISCESDRIFAERATITGSIGVITLHFNIAEFLANHGITHSTIKTGEHADMTSSLRDLSEKERKLMMDVIRDLYDQFREKVAGIRNMSVEKVHELGEGHVYSGVDALEIGLVDEIGGIDAAKKWMAAKLETENIQLSYQPRRKVGRAEKFLGGKGDDSPYALAGQLQGISGGINQFAIIARELAELNNTPQARMPDFFMD